MLAYSLSVDVEGWSTSYKRKEIFKRQVAKDERQGNWEKAKYAFHCLDFKTFLMC